MNQNELVRAIRKELAAKEKELADQKWIFDQFLQSPAWRATAPVRWIVNRLRNLRNGKAAEPPPAISKSTDDVPKIDAAPASDLKEGITSLFRFHLERFLSAEDSIELPKPATPTVSIVLVLFNRAELTLACLRSIAEHGGGNVEVVIVDNASSDDTPLLLERLRGARIVRNTENRHFLLGVNQAARECRGEFILLLNNDAQLLPRAIENALTTIRGAKDIGAVGGKIVLLDGSLQEAGNIVWRDGSCSGYGRGDSPFAPMYNFRRDVDYCSGAFLLTPRKVWDQLGGFDEAFGPAYYEETDYCMRLWKHGLRVVYEPTSAIVHYEFASSVSTAKAVTLQAERKSLFASRHRDVLESRGLADADRILQTRQRHTGRRILFFEDRVPHIWLGSGFPRAQGLIVALQSLGCFVTLFPLGGPSESWDLIHSDIPAETEVIMGWGREMVESFLRNRAGYYSTIIVSRPHNMEFLLPILKGRPEWFKNVEIIYDAEALFAARKVGLRKLSGSPMTEEEIHEAFAKEVSLVSAADCVVAVSEGERQTFLQHGIERVEVLGFSVDAVPSTNSFESRSGLLFVGAVHEEASPNGDSLIWFLTEIFPKIREKLGDVPLTIAGVNRSERIRELALPPVTVTGKLPSLTDLYANSRLFIAPTRYAAGIPLKINEAASYGLPVVATPLLAGQLGWTECELAIGGDAESFAARCVEIYTDNAKWKRLRDAALERARKECSPKAFEERVRTILGASGV